MLYKLFFFLLFPLISIAQNIPEKYVALAAKVEAFPMDKEATHLYIDEVSEVRITNKEGNILRFRHYEDSGIAAFHCGLCYALYDFKDGWIRTISTYDKNGCLIGDAEFEGMAIFDFEILKPERLKVQMAKLEEQDGNIQMHDAAEQIVLLKVLTVNGEVLREEYLDTDEYFMYQYLLYAP